MIKDAASARTIPEWQALAQVAGHYNIVTLFDRGTADAVEYMVFEYLSGGTLSDYLAKRKDPLTVDEALRLGRQVARALSHMHGKGMIHRDVAAANIWMDERHSAHLGDFDLAVLREAQDDSDSRSVSTEGYAAPERAAGKPVDERSDLYSLGAVLYEAVTGRRSPCEGPARNAEIAGRLAARRPVLPHRLTDVIGRLLAESPQDRPESAQEVLDALKVTRDPLDSEDAWTGTLPFPLEAWRLNESARRPRAHRDDPHRRERRFPQAADRAQPPV
jgi:eukaryotic-like serine/threonine-protein kinase